MSPGDARGEQFHLLVGVDARRWPGSARQVTPTPGPGFPNDFFDGDRLAGTADTGPVVNFQGSGSPLFQPNEFGSLSFTLRRGSVPAPPYQIPLLGIDFLGGPRLDLDGNAEDGQRSLTPVVGQSPVVVAGAPSLLGLALDAAGGTIELLNFDATGTNEAGPQISAEFAVTLTLLAGMLPDATPGASINPEIDTRTGSLVAFGGLSGTLSGVYRVDDLGFELWQDSISANSSTANQLGTFQFLGSSFRGWVIERDPLTNEFPTLTGEGLGTTLWALVDTSQIGQSFNTANGLAGGTAVILDGYPGDRFTGPNEGGTALVDLGGDIGAYFDQVVAPLIHPLSDRFVYLESAGFGMNNSADPVYLDTVGYDVVVVAQQTPADADADGDRDVDLRDFAAFGRCFTGDGGGPIAPACEMMDADFDMDVDLADYTAFFERLAAQ